LVSPVGPGLLGDTLRAQLDRDGEGLCALAFGTADAEACAAELRGRGLSATPPIDGLGRNDVTGAERAWRTVLLPASDTRGVALFAIEHASPPDMLRLDADSDPAVIHGVDHVVIMTADPDAAAALYRDRLGLRLAFDRAFEARRIRLLFFRIGGVTVELAAPLGPPDPTAPDRLWGVSWQVANVERARDRLAGAGVDVSDVRPGHKPGTRVCSVRSHTHGVATLLIEPASTPA
jgi:catechol 2,3-dioxygenase-like lactoylglutathione lyase family enzyme